jgi:glycosyltransferase involved in cell wall biosynthesis
MKVLQIAVTLPYPPDDGGRQGIFNVTRFMALSGAKVSMLTIDRPDSTVDPAELAACCSRFVRLRKDTSNVLWKAAADSLFSALPYNVGKFIDGSVLGEAIRLMTDDPCDVVQAESVYAAWYALQLQQRFPEALYVLRAHNVEQVIFERAAHSSRNPFLRAYLSVQAAKMRRYEDRVVPRFDLVVPVTEVDRSELERRTGRNGSWHVSPAGVDLDRIHPVEVSAAAADVAFAGPLRWLPNQQGVEWFLANVWPDIRADIPGSRFRLMGELPARARRSLGSPEGVDILGYVTSVEQYLTGCRVFVVPLLSGSGIRLKILNAAAWGIPVVSTSIGAEGLAFVNGSEILICDDPHEFARAVKRLLTDDSLWTHMREAALERVRSEYSWMSVVSDLLAAYEVAAERKRGLKYLSQRIS